MRIRTGAVGLGFVAGLMAVMAWLGSAVQTFGQALAVAEADAATIPAAEAPAAPAVETPETLSEDAGMQARVAQRLDALKSADLMALREAYSQCMQKAQELAVEGPALRQAAREAYEEARLNSDAAKEIHRQRAELDQQLDQLLRDLPEVKGKLEEIAKLEQDMLLELRVRTALAGLIAEREKQAPPPAAE